MPRWGKDLLTVAEIPRPALVELLRVAELLKRERRLGRQHPVLAGKTLGLLFEKPSTRTLVSFEAGMNQHGHTGTGAFEGEFA